MTDAVPFLRLVLLLSNGKTITRRAPRLNAVKVLNLRTQWKRLHTDPTWNGDRVEFALLMEPGKRHQRLMTGPSNIARFGQTILDGVTV